MSTTKYQVLARYYNTHTNNAITNDDKNTYEKTFQFYTEDASSSIAELIMEGNNPQNVKNDMLFAYAGTKKVYPTDGSFEYATDKLRMEKENILLSDQNKELEQSISISDAKIKECDKQLNETSSTSYAYLAKKHKADYDTYKADYDKYKSFKDSLIDSDGNFKPIQEWFALMQSPFTVRLDSSSYNIGSSYNPKYEYHWYVYVSITAPTYTGYSTFYTQYNDAVYGTIAKTAGSSIKPTDEEFEEYEGTVKCKNLKNVVNKQLDDIINAINNKMTASYNLYESNNTNLEKTKADKETEENNKIHYQQTIDANEAKIAENTLLLEEKGEGNFDAEHNWPYMIIDVYERVWFSPWFSVHVCSSLNSALEKAKVVVNAIGIDNVKIIKLVSIDQFIRIR